jgi:hypothetical protein
MCKTSMFTFILSIFLAIIFNSASAYQTTAGPAGVLKYDREKASPGYNLFTNGTSTYLLDMEGRLVKEWQWQRPGDTQLLENGHLLRLEVLRPPSSRQSGITWGGAAGVVSEYDWNGNLIWSADMDTEDEINHHMVHRMPNGNTLVIVWERISYDDAVAAGRDPNTINDPDVTDCYDSTFPPNNYICDFWPNKIVELDTNGDRTGWEWRAWDHVCNDQDASCLDINYRFPIDVSSHRASANFMHVNSIDFLPDPADLDPTDGDVSGTILINSRVFGEFFLIDYESGEIIDRWGNPCAYGAGDCPSYLNNGDQRLFGAHASHFIKSATDPGEGNVLVFNNGWMRPMGSISEVLEVAKGASGYYTNGSVDWQFKTASPTYSEFMGYVQELSNGNRLITMSMQGHLIEATRDTNEIVWEFVNPMAGGEVLCDLTEANYVANSMFRALRYSEDYPAFAGKNLNRRKVLCAKNMGFPE